jgi:predicted NUDIX family NTP pyrophosphohydrolase
MAKSIACGLLMCKWQGDDLHYFLVHPGGPFFRGKRAGVWSIPKGIPEENEEPLTTAMREFTEETGITPTPPFFALDPVKQRSGKIVHAWTFIGTWDPSTGIISNTFKLEWPPSSGKFQDFPEQDEGAWMNYEDARIAINPGQIPLLEQAMQIHEGARK